jgi:uncharacterized membrane protein
MDINFTSVTLIVGHLFVVCGLLFSRIPPRTINWIYGNRFYLSAGNAGLWEDAGRYSSQLMLISGVAFLVLGLIALFLPDAGVAGIVIAVGLLITFLIVLVTTTERYLKKLFEEYQKREDALPRNRAW